MSRGDVSFDLDFNDVARMLKDPGVERIVAREITRAVRKERTKAKRDIADRAGIRPQNLVHRRLKLSKAKRRRLRAGLRILVSPIPVIKLKGARDTRFRKRRRGVGVLASGRSFPNAFIAKGRSRTQQVFERRGSSRQPLDVVTVPIKVQAEQVIEERIVAARETFVEALPKALIKAMDRGSR